MKFAVLDFTTLSTSSPDALIQLAVVIIEQHEVVERFSAYLHPGSEIPLSISQLTGITNEMLSKAPPTSVAVEPLPSLLQDCVLIAQRLPFTYSCLQFLLQKYGAALYNGRMIDVMDASRVLFPHEGSGQLSTVCASLGIDCDLAQAVGNAEAVAQLWLRCLQRFDQLPLLSLQRLSQIVDATVADVDDLGWFMQEMCYMKEAQTAIDLDTAQYFRQFAIHVNDWSEDQPDSAEYVQRADLHAGEFASFYQQLKQSLKKKFARYEERPAQEQMMNEVLTSLQDHRHLMIEAGTGTGKSIGYLIPAIYYGLLHEEKVVVSTHTINLQEQMRQRDIPMLQELFPVPFRAAVLKGRNHYLCLRKFEHKINGKDYENNKDEALTAAQMVVWLGETANGEDEELHLGNKGRDFWRTVESDTESCLNRACPWFKKCFYHRARHQANIADVVITNHSLLFTDVKADNRLLPAYQRLVIDEAHHFVDVAAKHLGLDVRYTSFINTLFRLFRDSKTGLLPSLRFRLQKHESSHAMTWGSAIDGLYAKLIEVREQWDQLNDLLYQLLIRSNQHGQLESGQYVLRLKPQHLPAEWETLLGLEDNIYIALTHILKSLDRFIAEMKEYSDEYDMQSMMTDLAGNVKDLYRHRDQLRFFMKMSDDNFVYWLEGSAFYKVKSLQMTSVPIDVSPMLQHHFFEAKESVVMTSATLAVNQSFAYICDQMGLEPYMSGGKLRTVLLPHPFDYRKQSLVCIPRDFPALRGNGDGEFIPKLIESLRDVAIQTKGNMLVLFTSYRMLKMTYEGLYETLHNHGIQLFAQGVDHANRSRLTELFKEGKASVLLGTNSFWEGIDIPGEALSCLAIVRLPFQPPNHPLAEAKGEMLSRQGKNPFMSMSLPQAVIRFKQGFGRLVRTSADHGIAIVYDTRVIDTRYGKNFLYSLPGPKIEHMPTNQLVPRTKEWLTEEASP